MNSVEGKIILGIAAHPDDLEFGCSGTMASWIKQGAKGYYLILTDGSKGSEDRNLSNQKLRATRHKEQKAAAEQLGISEVFFLDLVDGELENNHLVRKQVVKIIRQIKPNIVITMDPTMVYDESWGFINHPDHRVAGHVALDCVFPFARNVKTYPELLEEGLEPHSVEEILLINFTKSNYFVDITDTVNQKLLALSQHKSQHPDFSSVEGWVKTRADAMGKKCKCKFAEGFIRIQISE